MQGDGERQGIHEGQKEGQSDILLLLMLWLELCVRGGGMTRKQLEQETGCKIILGGREG